MPPFNFTAIAIASFIPLIIGYIWYHPKVFGSALAKVEGHDDNEAKGHHPMVYVATVIGSFLISMLLAAILSTHSTEELSLMHGFFHGGSAAIFMGIPTFAIIALFESKPAKYILIHALYWLVSMAIMGGIIGWFVS